MNFYCVGVRVVGVNAMQGAVWIPTRHLVAKYADAGALVFLAGVYDFPEFVAIAKVNKCAQLRNKSLALIRFDRAKCNAVEFL
jgi:hypothetical protein